MVYAIFTLLLVGGKLVESFPHAHTHGIPCLVCTAPTNRRRDPSTTGTQVRRVNDGGNGPLPSAYFRTARLVAAPAVAPDIVVPARLVASSFPTEVNFCTCLNRATAPRAPPVSA